MVAADSVGRWRRQLPSGLANTLARVDVVLILALVVTAACQIYLYGQYEGTPTNSPTGGWEGWWDQSQYLKSTRAFAVGNLDPANHWYPPGYSLIGVPFVWLFPRDPFLIPNLVAMLVYVWAFLKFFRPYLGAILSLTVFAIVLLLPVVAHIPHPVRHILWLQFIVPWNTVPTAALFMCILLIFRGLTRDDPVWKDLLLGTLAGAIVAIRPIDAVALLPIGAFYAYRRLISVRRWANVGAATGGALAVIGPVLVLMLVMYGGLKTPYSENINFIGLSVSDMPQRAFNIFVDAGRTHGETNTALLGLLPWLAVLGPFGIVGAILRFKDLGPPMAAAGVAMLTYLSFNDFWPLNILRYFLIHYITWFLPVLAGAGLAGLAFSLTRPSWFDAGVVAVAATIALAGLRAEPSPVAGATIAAISSGRGVDFRIGFDRRRNLDAIDLPGAVSGQLPIKGNPYSVTVDDQPIDLFSGYRVLQFPDRVRLIFNRHVAASSVGFRLDGDVTGHMAEGAEPVPVVFGVTYRAPWAPHTSDP